MTTDPVLQSITLRDPNLRDRVVGVLLELALSSPAPERAPKPGASRNLGVCLAWYDGLSDTEVLRMTRSSDPRVRRILASRTKCPSEALILLALDPDERVRYGVFTNAAATDEARAAVTLSSPPEEVARWVERGASVPAGRVDSEGHSFTQADIRALIDMPADWDPLKVTPSGNACTDRMVVWTAGRPSLWPSTSVFLQPAAPTWILEAFSEHGHPAALIDSRLLEPLRGVATDAGEQLKELVDSGLLIRALWREMAICGTLELSFVPDYLGWSHLIPRTDSGPLLPLGSATEYVISGGEECYMGLAHADEWVLVSHFVSLDSAIDVLKQVFENWIEYGLENEAFVSAFNDPDTFGDAETSNSHVKTLDRFALAGLSYLQRQRGIKTATEAAMESIRALHVCPYGFVSEARDLSGYAFQVEIGDTDLPWISYSESGSQKMKLLAELIRESMKDLAVSTWGVSNHFLECMAMHPSTSEEVRVLCTATD